MSFKCENCKTVQESGTKAVKVVTQIRNVTYPAILDDRGNIDKIPTGHETVKELTVCPDCADLTYNVMVMEKKTITAYEKMEETL